MLEQAQRGQLVFELARDFGFQLLGGGAFQRGTDDHCGQIGVGKVLNTETLESEDAKQRQH